MAEIAIYVVTTEVKAHEEKQLTKIKTELAKRYGGSTVFKAKEGNWFNPQTRKLEFDKVEVWQIITDKVDGQFIDDVTQRIKAITKQKSQLWTKNESIVGVMGLLDIWYIRKDATLEQIMQMLQYFEIGEVRVYAPKP